MSENVVPRYQSVEEVMRAVAEIRDELALQGAPEAADELTAALDCFYTTSSEALGELRAALEATRQAWDEHLSGRYTQLADHAASEATRLLGMG